MAVFCCRRIKSLGFGRGFPFFDDGGGETRVIRFGEPGDVLTERPGVRFPVSCPLISADVLADATEESAYELALLGVSDATKAGLDDRRMAVNPWFSILSQSESESSFADPSQTSTFGNRGSQFNDSEIKSSSTLQRDLLEDKSNRSGSISWTKFTNCGNRKKSDQSRV